MGVRGARIRRDVGASAYIGASHAQAEAGGFLLGSWFVEVFGDDVEPHGHDEAHFMFAASGRYHSHAAGADADVARPLTWNPPQTWHEDRFETPGNFVSMTVPGARWEEVDEIRLPREPVRLHAPRPRVLIGRLMRHLAAWDPSSPALCEALCLELIGAAGRPAAGERRRPAWFGRACDALRGVGDDRANLAEIGRQVGVHPYHLARTFRTFERCSPTEFALAARLDRAAGLLSSTRLSLAEVALASGFADQSHFTRRFGEAYGSPPGVYRRRTTVFGRRTMFDPDKTGPVATTTIAA